MISLTAFFKNQIDSQRSKSPFVKVTFKNVIGTTDYDMNSFLSSFGSISRKLSIETRAFSPGGHNLELRETQLLGDMFLKFRDGLNVNTFVGIEYDVEAGFLDGGTEDTVLFYKGKIFSQRENRIGGAISIGAKDTIKDINDFKVCTIMPATDVFEYDDSTTDRRGFQQIIKYGEHKLILRDVDNSGLRNRENPFTATLGVFNNPTTAGGKSRRTGDAAAHANEKGRLWYFPFHNTVSASGGDYTSSGTLKAYYWDYRDGQRFWRQFDSTNFEPTVNLTILGNLGANAEGFYLEVNDDAITGFATGDWDDYIDGTGGWANSNPDPAVCIETKNSLVDGNPVRIIYDLLTNSQFVNLDNTIDTGLIDSSTTDFSAIDTDYSWDRSYDFYDEDQGELNLSFTQQVSLKAVIEEITKIANLYFFQSANKSSSQDRSIRLETNRIINPCDNIQGSSEVVGEYSTRDRVLTYTAEVSNDGQATKVITSNFDSTVSTNKQMDIVTKGTGTRVLQLGGNNNPKVYWFDSLNTAQAVADRTSNQLAQPIEIARVRIDSAGFPIELADLITLHDKLNDRSVIMQVFEVNTNLTDFSTNLVCRRYNLLYGPDDTNPFKLWAFVGCAYVDNDQIAGSGTKANITSGLKVVTLNSPDTIDTLRVKIGMDITIDDQHFRVAKITSTTELETDVAATATEVDETWSIGNSFHVF